MATPFSLHDFASRHGLASQDLNQQYHTAREDQHAQNELRVLDRLPAQYAFDADDLPAQEFSAQPAQQHAQDKAANQSDRANDEAAARPSTCQPETPAEQRSVNKRKAFTQDQVLARKRSVQLFRALSTMMPLHCKRQKLPSQTPLAVNDIPAHNMLLLEITLCTCLRHFWCCVSVITPISSLRMLTLMSTIASCAGLG